MDFILNESIDFKGILASLARMQKSTWQIQEAKNRLSEVVECSLKQGPQTITRHGKPTAVVLSFSEYKKLNIDSDSSLINWLQSCPGTDLADWMDGREKEEIRSISLQ